MNYYANILAKVKSDLKIDDQLTKEQSKVFQWNHLLSVPDHDFNFVIGKAGINTMYLLLDNIGTEHSRRVCYAEEALEILTKLSKHKAYCYVALDAKKNIVGYSVFKNRLKSVSSAVSICPVGFDGKIGAPALKAAKTLLGKGRSWVENKR